VPITWIERAFFARPAEMPTPHTIMDRPRATSRPPTGPDQCGLVTAAEICDHVEPHHGDVNKFWLGPFQSLCKRCHDSTKRFVEMRGFRPDIGIDGRPIDSRHPVYRAR